MKILKIEIGEFGGLKNKSFDLSDTINIIRGDNESGKSTLLLFIKFMLYGVARKARGELYSEADRALSWETFEASGSMTVLHEGKAYRIERRMYKPSASSKAPVTKLQVIDCERELACEGILNPGEFFLGINSDVFESSCGISQLRCTGINGAEITDSLQNIMSSADESLDAQKTIKLLESARIKYLHKNGKGGSIFELEAKKDSLEAQYRRAVEDNMETEKLIAQIDDTAKKLEEISELKNTSDELCSKLNLLTVVKLFDKLHEYEDIKHSSEENIVKLKEKISKNRILPDRKFLATLNNSLLELELSRKELEREQEKLSVFEADVQENSEQAKKIKILQSLGGVNEVLSNFKKQKSKSAVFSMLYIVSFVALLACTAVSVAFNPLLLVSSGITAVFFAVFLALAGKAKRKLREIYRDLEINKKDAGEFFVKYASLAEKQALHNKEIERIRADISIKKHLLDTALQKARLAISSYLPINTEDAREAEAILRVSIDEISKTLDEISEAEAVIDAQKAKIADISSNLSDYNEHQVRKKVPVEILSMSDEKIKEAQQKKSFYDVQLQSLNNKKASRERALLERKYSTLNPFEILSELEKTTEKLEKQRKIYDSLALAIESLEVAMSNMKNTVTPQLRSFASEYMARFTDNKYSSLGVTENLDMSMSADGFSHPLDAFSTGTRDIAYIALRLSLVHLLPMAELPPILLDETVAMVDDKRTVEVFSILDEYCREGGQCILLTCHDREEKLCEENKINYNLIAL